MGGGMMMSRGFSGGMMMSRGFNTSRSFTNRSFSSTGMRRGFAGASTPPGWSHGRKTGWRGGTMPPGLAKKMQ
jgi:hypothetical protein